MTDKKLLNKALDFIVETQEDGDFICTQMCEGSASDYCEKNCQNLNRQCVIMYLELVYKKTETEK